MYDSTKTSVCAASIAATSSGKYCSPLVSRPMRLPAWYSGTLELRAHREVVRQERPGRAAVHLRLQHREAAHVDAVQAEDRQHARVGAQMTAECGERSLRHAEALLQDRARALAPVVEVAGDDDGGIALHQLLQAPA